MKKYVFGVDVGGTTVKMGLFNVDGEVLDKWEIKTHTENGGEAILPDIAASALAKLEEKNIVKDEVAGIGIGIPGPINDEGVVPHTANLGWGYKEVTRELEELTGLPCKGGNDANVAALGEAWKGGAAGYSNVVMVTLGTGVGGGIIIGGKIITGSNGAGGEIGHLHVDDNIPGHCGCGNQGCLEQVASATGITNLANQALAASDKPSMLREGEVSAKTVFDAVKADDELAKEIAERFGKYLGTALANITAIVDPQAIVIGGGVSKAGPILLEYVEKYYQKYCFKSCRNVKFTLATLGNDAGIFGSAKLVL
ncbi:MAG: ROK family glucokinase [Lachnospiraceae bacterium]|nr:ROK family glucokinase [Lachnospiraceae bacterium]MEE1014791.1 ROK family glucokinase [Lachnospiraceae bacterium]